jgi:ABC-type sugar transport system ATPase subunit
MVFQDYALYPQMTVFDNLAFGMRRRKVPKERIEERVRSAAASLDLERYLDRKPGQLSGGQAQRVALGRALVREPQVFLMDEPLSNLDAKLRTQTRGEIKLLQKEVKTTTVYVTHDQVEAMTMGDRIAVMNEGRLVQVGTPDELYERPSNRFVAGFIGAPAMSFFEASAETTDGATRLRGEGIDVTVPTTGVYRGAVTVGVRPETARRWDDTSPDAEGLSGPLDGVVAFSEALGRETFIGVDIGESRIVIYEEGRSGLLPGDKVSFGLRADGLRIFDAETGDAIPVARTAVS